MRDLLVSCDESDRRKADWIAATLRQAGHRVVYYRDFPPGYSFVGRLDAEIEAGTVVVAILSPSALESRWPRHERESALQRQLDTGMLSLIQVVVEPCEPKGLYAPLTWIDLVGLEKKAAKSKLLAGITLALGGEMGVQTAEAAPWVGPSRPNAGTKANRLLPSALIEESSVDRWSHLQAWVKPRVAAIAAGALLLVCALLGLQLLRLQRESKAALQPSVNVVVAALTPLESVRRGGIHSLASVQPADAFIALIVFPLGELSSAKYCLRFSTFGRREVEKICGLEVKPAGHFQVGLPPNRFAPGHYRLELYQESRPKMTLATYALQLEARR